MTRILVWSIAVLAAAAVIWAVMLTTNQPRSAGPRVASPTEFAVLGAYPAPVQISTSIPKAVVTSEADARAIVEAAMPQLATADNVIVRSARRQDLDTIVGVIRHDVPGLSASTDPIWILAYESPSGFNDLGRLDMGLGEAPNQRTPQPVAYFAVDKNSGRITVFGLLPSRDKMLEFSRLTNAD
jgi:hypothetical protein